MTIPFHVYTVANSPSILDRDLKASPDLVAGTVPLTVFWDQPNASVAYAAAIREMDADYLVFAHQDVLFPEGWFTHLARELEKLEHIDPTWAVVGVFGADSKGELQGHVWDSALGGIIGAPFSQPIRAASLDEIVLIVKRGSGAKFDPELPGFHLYGTDIVLCAGLEQQSAYIVHAPVIHNTKPILSLGRDYIEAYNYMRRKWRAVLPYPTVIVELTDNKLPLLMQRARIIHRSWFRKTTYFHPIPDPARPAMDITRDIFGNSVRLSQ